MSLGKRRSIVRDNLELNMREPSLLNFEIRTITGSDSFQLL